MLWIISVVPFFLEWHWFLSLGVGLSIAGLVLLVGKILFRRPASVSPPSSLSPHEREPQRLDPFVNGGRSDKRLGIRRQGNPVEVFVTQNPNLEKPIQGLIVNRSQGGVCLWLDKSFEVGTLLHILPCKAPPETPWTPLEIRNCLETQGHFQVGCQFVRTPPWSIMLLFG
jgi:hypothetical protein